MTSAPKDLTNVSTTQVCSMATRMSKLLKTCKSLPEVTHSNYKTSLMLDRDYKVMYTFIAKSGSTMLRRLITSLKPGTWHRGIGVLEMVNKGYPLFESYNDTEKQKLLKEYKKVVLVRHPFDRLRSAYYNRVVLNTAAFGLKRYNEVIRKYRQDKADKSKVMKFDEFIKYVLNDPPNLHWAPYYESSRPCYIKYDYILRLETWQRDLEIFAKEVLKKSMKELEAGRENLGRYRHTRSRALARFSKFVPEFRSVSKEDMAKLMEKFGRDFEVFGYSWGNHTTGYCSIPYEGGTCC